MVDCGDKEDESGDEEEIPPRWHLKLVRHGLVCCLCVLLVIVMMTLQKVIVVWPSTSLDSTN